MRKGFGEPIPLSADGGVIQLPRSPQSIKVLPIVYSNEMVYVNNTGAASPNLPHHA